MLLNSYMMEDFGFVLAIQEIQANHKKKLYFGNFLYIYIYTNGYSN